MPTFYDRTSPTWFGRDDEQARLSLLGMSSRSVMTTYEVEDNRLTRSVLSGGGRIVGSERTTAKWSNPQAYETLKGHTNLIEADRKTFGSRLHAKVGEFTSPTGDRVMFVGTANMTKTGLGMATLPEYSRFSGQDKTQFNYFVATRDANLVRQMDTVLGAIAAGRAPVSTQNLLVASPKDTGTALDVLSRIIGDRGNHAALYIASATLSDPHVLDSIIQKARRGDQVYVGLGGLNQQDINNEGRAFQKLTAAGRTLTNLHVGWGNRPWHANVIAMGDTYMVGSMRFSKTAVEGYNGERSTEVMLHARDARVAADIARQVQSNFDFGAGEQLRMPFTKLGTFMPSMMPLHGISLGGQRKAWQYVVDPQVIFDADTRKAYAWAAATHEQGSFVNPMRSAGRFYRHLYTEMYAGGHEGQLPSSMPDVITRSDREAMLPTFGELWRGQITDYVNQRFGSGWAATASELTEARGNRGPLGSLLVNLGAQIDRRNHQDEQLRVYGSADYRPIDAKAEGTYADGARWVDDTLFNLGMNIGLIRSTMFMAEIGARAASGMGRISRTIGDRVLNAPVHGPVSAFVRDATVAAGQAGEYAMDVHAGISKGLWGVQREAYGAVAGDVGRKFIDDVMGVYDHKSSLKKVQVTDRQLALDLRRQRGGKINVKTVTLPSGHVHTIYEIEHDAKRMTLHERFRAVNQVANRFIRELPGGGLVADVLNLAPNPHIAGMRATRRAGWGAALRGDWSRAQELWRDAHAQGQFARSYGHLYGETGLTPGRALARRGVQALFVGAVATHAYGMLASAKRETLETQIDRENTLHGAAGTVTNFGWADLAPRSGLAGILDIMPALAVGLSTGLSWGAQFVAGMSMNPFNPLGAAQRATKMVSVASDLRGYNPYREVERAGLRDWSASGIAGYFVDRLTAMQRDMTMSFMASREDLMYKVVTKTMATTMMVNETERMSLGRMEKLVAAGAGPRDQAELGAIRATLDMAQQWAGQADKAQVSLSLAYGMRIGYLPLGSVWGGAVVEGGKTTFMLTAMLGMPSGIHGSVKLPYYYSDLRGRKGFRDWYRDHKNEEEIPMDGALRALIDATGGEDGWTASAVRFGMSFGYEPNTNWEASVRLGAGMIGVGLATTYGFAPLGAYAGAGLFARNGGSLLDAGRNVAAYIRTGEMRGSGFSMLGNMNRGMAERMVKSRGIAKFAYGMGAVGFGLANELAELPLTLVPRALNAGFTVAAQGITRGNVGWVNELTRRTGQLTRGYRVGARGAVGLFMGYTGYAFARAMSTGDPQGYREQMGGYRQMLKAIPLIGNSASRLFGETVDLKNVAAPIDPQEARRFAAGPTDSLSAESGAAGDKGRFRPGYLGIWDMLNRAAKQTVGMGKPEEFFMTAEAYSDLGLHAAFKQTGPDSMEMATWKITKMFFGGLMSIGYNTGWHVTRTKSSGEIDSQLAAAIGGSRKVLETEWVGRKRAAFMGRMFMPGSPMYEADPALKLAMAVRYNESRAALGMWPSEYRRYHGEFLPGGAKPAFLHQVTYTAQVRGMDGGVTQQFRWGNLMGGIWRKAGALDQADFSKTYAGQRQADRTGTSDVEAEDDIAALMGAPRTEEGTLLGIPTGARTLSEYQVNWLANPTTLVGAAAVGALAAVPFAAHFMARPMFAAWRGVRGERETWQERVERYMPTHQAKTHGVLLSPEAPHGPGAHPHWTLSGNKAGLYRVDLPVMGGDGLRAYGDYQGRPFADSTDPRGTVMAGRDKAKLVERSFNTLLARYEGLPQIRTAGAMGASLGRVLDVLDKLHPTSMPAGHMPSAAWFETQKAIGDLGLRLPTTSTAAITDDLMGEYEQIMRRMLNEFGTIAGTAPIDMNAVFREAGMTGAGLAKNVVAGAGLEPAFTPHTPGMHIPGATTKPADYLFRNDPTGGYAAHRAAVEARLTEIKSTAPGYLRRGAAGAVGLGLGAFDGFGRVMQGLSIAQVATGMAAQSSDFLTTEHKEKFAEAGGASLTAELFLGGSAVAGAAAVGYFGLVGLPALLVGGGLAALGFGGMMAQHHLSESALSKRPEERNWAERASTSLGTTMTSVVSASGRAAASIPGSSMVGNAISRAAIGLQTNVTGSLYGLARTLTPKGQTQPTGFASFLIGTANFIGPMLAPGNLFEAAKANQEGWSFSLSPLWAQASPIFWGRNSATPEGGGTGWMMDAGALAFAQQERLRLSGAMGHETVLDMVGRDALGLMEGGNDMPAHDYSLKSLYMQRGRGTGGLGNAQAARAFRYRSASGPDSIIQGELLRRGLIYETGILGGAWHRTGHVYGGFVGGDATIGTTGRGRPQKPFTGEVIKPAQGGDLVAALRSATFTGTGGGPNGPSITRWNPLIEASAARHHVPAGMVRALMSLESGGNPNDTSWAGAIGLMQVMPFHFSARGISGQKRYDPATNIEVGTDIFAGYYHAMEKRVAHLHLPPDRVLALAVASYNTGPGWSAYDKGQFPVTWDGYSTAKSYSDTVMARYYQTRVSEKPLVTKEQQATLERILPEYAKGGYPGSLDKFMVERGGLSPAVAQTLAGRVRTNLYTESRWLPQDDPGYWSKKLNASLGRIATPQQKADAILEAAGIQPPSAAPSREQMIAHLNGPFVATAHECFQYSRHLIMRMGGKDIRTDVPADLAHRGVPISQLSTLVATGGVHVGDVLYATFVPGSDPMSMNPSSGRHWFTYIGDGKFADNSNKTVQTAAEMNSFIPGRKIDAIFHPFGTAAPSPQFKALQEAIAGSVDSKFGGDRIADLLQERMGYDRQRAEQVQTKYRQMLGERGFFTGTTHDSAGRPIAYGVRDMSKNPTQGNADQTTLQYLATLAAGTTLIFGTIAAAQLARKGLSMVGRQLATVMGWRKPEAAPQTVAAHVSTQQGMIGVDPVRAELVALREDMQARAAGLRPAAPAHATPFHGDARLRFDAPLERTGAHGLAMPRATSVSQVLGDSNLRIVMDGMREGGIGFSQGRFRSPDRGDHPSFTPEYNRVNAAPRRDLHPPLLGRGVMNTDHIVAFQHKGVWSLPWGHSKNDVLGVLFNGTHAPHTDPVRKQLTVLRQQMETGGVGRANAVATPDVIELPGRVLPHRGPDGRFRPAPVGQRGGMLPILDRLVNDHGYRWTTGRERFGFMPVEGESYPTHPDLVEMTYGVVPRRPRFRPDPIMQPGRYRDPSTGRFAVRPTPTMHLVEDAMAMAESRVPGSLSTRTVSLLARNGATYGPGLSMLHPDQPAPATRQPIGYELLRGRGLTMGGGLSVAAAPLEESASAARAYSRGMGLRSLQTRTAPLLLGPGVTAEPITRGRLNGAVTPEVIALGAPANPLLLGMGTPATSQIRGRLNGAHTPDLIALGPVNADPLLLGPGTVAAPRGRLNTAVTPGVIPLGSTPQLLLGSGATAAVRGRPNTAVAPAVIPLGPVPGPGRAPNTFAGLRGTLALSAAFAALDINTLSDSTSSPEERSRATWNLGMVTTSTALHALGQLATATGHAAHWMGQKLSRGMRVLGRVATWAASKAFGRVSMGLAVGWDALQTVFGTSQTQRREAGLNVVSGATGMYTGSLAFGAAAAGTAGLIAAGVITAPAWAPVAAGLGAAVVAGGATVWGINKINTATKGLLTNTVGTVASAPGEVLRWIGRASVPSFVRYQGQFWAGLGRHDNSYMGAMTESSFTSHELNRYRFALEESAKRKTHSIEYADYVSTSQRGIDVEAEKLAIGRALVRPAVIQGVPYYRVMDTYKFQRMPGNWQTGLARAVFEAFPQASGGLSPYARDEDKYNQVTTHLSDYAKAAWANKKKGLEVLMGAAGSWHYERTFQTDLLVPQSPMRQADRDMVEFWRRNHPSPDLVVQNLQMRERVRKDREGENTHPPLVLAPDILEQMSPLPKPPSLAPKNAKKKMVVTLQTNTPQGRQGSNDSANKAQPKPRPTVTVKGGRAQIKGHTPSPHAACADVAPPTPTRSGVLDRASNVVYDALVHTGWF
jgi:hypothetical protein